MTLDPATREDRANVRDDRANNRDDRASVRDGRADDRENAQHGTLAWLFAVLVIIGMALTVVLVRTYRELDAGNDRAARIEHAVDVNRYTAEMARYEQAHLPAC